MITRTSVQLSENQKIVQRTSGTWILTHRLEVSIHYIVVASGVLTHLQHETENQYFSPSFTILS